MAERGKCQTEEEEEGAKGMTERGRCHTFVVNLLHQPQRERRGETTSRRGGGRREGGEAGDIRAG